MLSVDTYQRVAPRALASTRAAAPHEPGARAFEADSLVLSAAAQQAHAGPRVPFIHQMWPAGADRGYANGKNNCGPASMAMVARALGWGAEMTDAQLITYFARIGGTNASGTGVDGVVRMGKHMGQPTEARGPGADVAWIDAQLESGRLVIANGDYWAMPPHVDRRYRSGHYVVVLGRAEDGAYMVHDPFHDNGGEPLRLSAGELATFIAANPNGGYQLAVG